MIDDLTRSILEQRDNIENQRNREIKSNEESYIKRLEQENQAYKEAIKRCYTPEEIDFEIMSVKAELEAEKDINNNLHKTIDKLRVNLYETQQENTQLKSVLKEIREYIKTKPLYEEEYDYNYDDELYLSDINSEKAEEELLEIIDKGLGEKEVSK